jgi:TPR repeat protein
MLLSNSEIEKLEKKIDSLRDQGHFTAVKVLCKDASKRGSGSASSMLASGYDKNSKLHPDVFDSLFIKERRRSKRYCNRALKLFRRQAKLGSYRAMFSLYGNFYIGYPRRLKLKTRRKSAEYWLRRAAESGDEIPVWELAAYVRNNNR